MSDLESSNWSETAASNNASPPDGWPEGMLPSGVNNSAREMMGALKRDWDRVHGVISSTGSANAYVVTYTTAPAAYVNGQIFSFKTNFANTGSATANINSLGAKTIQKQASSGLANLTSGDMPSGIHVMLKYDSTADKLIWLNPTFGAGGTTPGGSTNDVQYNAGAGSLGGVTLSAGQPIIGVTSAAPAGGVVLGVYGGSLVLLEQHTASSSATLDFTTGISATYDDYLFEFVNINAATSADDFRMRVGTGGGPTWDTGSNYKWSCWAFNQAGGTAATGNATDSAVTLITSLSNASTSGLGGHVKLFGPGNTTFYKISTWQVAGLQSSGNFSQANGAKQYLSATAVTGVRFYMSTGNIASGTIRLYGIAKA